MRLNKVGIPILDPPVNRLKGVCHPALHQWVSKERRDAGVEVVDVNHAFDVDEIVYECAVCGMKDVEQRFTLQG